MNFMYVWRIIDKINALDPDIVHLQDGYPWLAMLMWRLKAKIVTTMHDPKQHLGEEKFWETFRDRKNKKHTDRYIVHGKYLKRLLHSHMGIPKSKIDTIHHGSMDMMYERLKRKKKGKRVLFFGRIWPYKGVDYLIKSEPYISKKVKDFKIVIAGQGEDFDKYQKLIKNPKRFEIHNRYIDDEEIPQLMTDSDVVVFPYIEATQSGVLTVAYSFGKPVVATKVGSIPEIVIDGQTGLLVRPKDSKELGEAIVKILSDTKLSAKLIKGAKSFNNKVLGWDVIAKQTLKTYERCLKAKKS